MSDKIYWLWLVASLGPANKRIWDIMGEFDSPKEAYTAITENSFFKITRAEMNSCLSTNIEQLESIINYCDKNGYTIVTFDDEAYPSRLRGIFNPPALLFCMGDISFIENELALTVVGTRHPSEYSVRVAKEICTQISRVGMVIVSGFALGIDSIAHQSALLNNARTIAVLGCGLDYDYPRENAQVKSVIAKRGAVITEYFPGAKPNPRNFPLRNRILAGLGMGTLVVEAAERSGSLITAELALQSGRDIFCVPPGDILDSRYKGVVKYLREGATCVFSYLDIIYEYYEGFAHRLSAIPTEHISTKEEDSLLFESRNISKRKKKTADKVVVSENESTADQEAELDLSEFSGEQAEILRLLMPEALLVDELSVKSGIEVSELFMILTELEIMGVVVAQAGKCYAINPNYTG